MGSFPGGSDDKEYACNVGDLDLIPGWEDALEKGMATHSSILAWEIPWREELSLQFSWVQFSRSVVSNSVTPGLPVHHQLPEFTQTHVHWVSDAIQPSHPLSSPSPPAFNLSQHQGLFQWVSSSHQVAKVLEFQFQHQSKIWGVMMGQYWFFMSNKSSLIIGEVLHIWWRR